MGTLSAVITYVVRLETSADVWNTLKDAFIQASDERELTLQSQLESLKRESGSSLNDFLCNFKNLCDQLDAIDRRIAGPRKVFRTLNGLGSDYQTFTNAILAKNRGPSLQELASKLQSCEGGTNGVYALNY